MINPPIGAIETAQAAKDHDHYAQPVEGKWRGRGVASGILDQRHRPGMCHRQPQLRWHGQPDHWLDGHRRALARQRRSSSREVLGIPVEDVNPQVGDTDAIGYTSMTGGSGAAFKTGWASYEAAQDVKRQMIDRAAFAVGDQRRRDRARRRRLPAQVRP